MDGRDVGAGVWDSPPMAQNPSALLWGRGTTSPALQRGHSINDPLLIPLPLTLRPPATPSPSGSPGSASPVPKSSRSATDPGAAETRQPNGARHVGWLNSAPSVPGSSRSLLSWSPALDAVQENVHTRRPARQPQLFPVGISGVLLPCSHIGKVSWLSMRFLTQGHRTQGVFWSWTSSRSLLVLDCSWQFTSLRSRNQKRSQLQAVLLLATRCSWHW